jgi:hypothetical protein
MKKLLYISFFFLPVIAFSQQPWYKSSPLDNAWKYVGTPFFSAGEADFITLAFSSSGQPYVAFKDYGNLLKATVTKFDGTNWVYVGNAGFSSGVTTYTNLVFSPSGQPYVAFADGGNSGKATVMKYDSVSSGISELFHPQIPIYPNPATDKITIETSATPTKSQLSITNLNGQALITRQITEPKTHVDISMLPSGVYFERLTNEKTVTVGKIIKQ